MLSPGAVRWREDGRRSQSIDFPISPLKPRRALRGEEYRQKRTCPPLTGRAWCGTKAGAKLTDVAQKEAHGGHLALVMAVPR